MMVCWCALAGTGACKNCPRYIAEKQEIGKIYTTPTQTTGTSYISEIIEPKRGDEE